MKYITRKFNGDCSYSWAVFRAPDVKGMRGIIFDHEAQPVMNGMSRSEAQATAKRLTRDSK